MKRSPKELVMEALDTNILVRIATRDDEVQLGKVEKLMRENFSAPHPAWVSTVVLAELAWVLTRCYGYRRPDVGAFLHQLLHTASICVEDQAVAKKAIELFLAHSADFSDCLILARNESRSITPTHTLDRKAAKLDGFHLL